MYTILVNEMNIRGGTHKQVVRLCEYLKNNNYEYELITKKYAVSYTYPECRNLNIKSMLRENAPLKFEVRNNGGNSIKERITRKLQRIREDFWLYKLISSKSTVVNFHDNGMSLCMWMCIISGKKIIWQINDLPGVFFEGVSKSQKREKDNYKCKFYRWYYRFLAKHVDCITVNVSKNKERVIKCLGRNASVLYCGTDIIEGAKLHAKINNMDEIHLVSTGVFFPYRNYETIVDVVHELVLRNVNCTLDIIGSTDTNKAYADKINAQVNKYNLQKRVKIWGQVDEDTYNELYAKADIFLFLNIEQSWGLAVFEAMGQGLPVIVSNSVGAIELLNDRIDSIIVDPKNVNVISDEIQKLAGESSYYSRISSNAVKSVKRFTWDNLYSSKMVKIFADMENKK